MSEPKRRNLTLYILTYYNKAFGFSGTTSANKDSSDKHKNKPHSQNSCVLLHTHKSELHKKATKKNLRYVYR